MTRAFSWLVALALLASAVQAQTTQPAAATRKASTTATSAPRPPAPSIFSVAAIQFASEFGQPERNRPRLAALVREAAKRGANIVVLPETAITGYMSYGLDHAWQVGDRPVPSGVAGVDPSTAAETVPGPSTEYFAKIAKELGIYLTVPLVEVDRKTGHYYNTVVLLDPAGQQVIHYRKVNPWPWAEQGWATEGDLGHAVVDTPYGRLGVLICFDIHHQARALADLKVDTLLYSIAWVDTPGSDWFASRLPTIARLNHLNIVGANWTLPDGSPVPQWIGYGQTRVIANDGAILAKAGKAIGAELVYADLPVPKDAEQMMGR
jgi:predicted amidohydrolase